MYKSAHVEVRGNNCEFILPAQQDLDVHSEASLSTVGSGAVPEPASEGVTQE